MFINNVRMSEHFTSHLTQFMQNYLPMEIANIIRTKTSAFIGEWNDLIQNIGKERALKTIEKYLKSHERSKLTWSKRIYKLQSIT